MKCYLTYFKKELEAGLQYKASALSGLTTQYFWGIIFAVIYTALYKRTTIEDINLSQLMSYLWLTQAFFALIFLSIREEGIITSIKNGEVAYELVRPYDVYKWWFAKFLAKRYAQVALRCLPIIIVALVLPEPYNLSLPNSLISFSLFFITLFLGSFIIVEINLIITIIAFFSNEDKGIASIFYSIGNLFAGFDIPLPLLPGIILLVSNYLPFRYIGDLPFRIYSGNIGFSLAINSIVIQFVWIIVLYLIGKILMKFALKNVSVQGG